MAKDMLFATLDPTMRKIALPGGGPEVILSDTVGFISDLPTELVAAFRATLEEVTAADLICHVRDISHPETETQAEDVHAILESLGVAESTPQIEVWNKIDALDPETRITLENRALRDPAVHLLSAVTGEGMQPLADAIVSALAGQTRIEELHLGFDEGRQRAWLFEKGLVESETQDETGYALVVRWNETQAAQYRSISDR